MLSIIIPSCILQELKDKGTRYLWYLGVRHACCVGCLLSLIEG